MRQQVVFSVLFMLACAPTARVAKTEEKSYIPAASWQRIAPQEAGWNAEKLKDAARFAMQRKSSGVVILQDGRLLLETYQDVERPTARYRRMVHGKAQAGGAIEDVASVQKSVVSFLLGVAREKGLIQLDDAVAKHLGPGWSRATREQEAEVTIRHLVTMTSGLNDQLKYVAPPGKQWRYNTTAYSRTLLAISAAAKASPNELTKAWLTGPTGMRDSKWVKRAGVGGALVNQYGFAASARDLARFGLLMSNQGVWRDKVLLADREYLRQATSPSQKLNPSYGYLWWLNGQEQVLRRGRLVRGPLLSAAPADMYAALGALGRKCYVAPARGLVVVRLGDNPDSVGQPRFDAEFWRLLMQAAPAK